MKKLKYILIIPIVLAMLTSCEEEDKNPVFDSDATPRIFGWSSDNVYRTRIENPLKLDLSVSPADGATYQWILDGEVISDKREFEYLFDEAREYTLKFAVTRNGVTNSRTARVMVIKPFVPKLYKKKMVGFISRDGSLQDINFDNLTHLVISSAIVGDPDRDALVDTTFTNLNIPILVTAAHNAGVYVMLDVTGNFASHLNGGGLFGDKGFYTLIQDDDKRKEILETIQKFALDNQLDGINIYLNNHSEAGLNAGILTTFYNDVTNYLIEGTAPDKEFFYSVTVPSSWTNGEFAPVASIDAIDWVNFQIFRNEGTTPVDHSSFNAVETLIGQWRNWYALPAEKVVVGFPAFGLGYDMPGSEEEWPSLVNWGNLHLYTKYYSFKEILDLDPEAHTKDKLDIANGIFYDGHPKIQQKAQYVIDNDLGGLMLWSLESDTRTTGKSLLEAANKALGND